MVIFPLAPDQTIAQMWSNGARGGAIIWSEDTSVYYIITQTAVTTIHWHVIEQFHSQICNCWVAHEALYCCTVYTHSHTKLRTNLTDSSQTAKLASWIVHGFTSPLTQYRLYGRRFLTGQKTKPTVSKYWRRKLQRKTQKTQNTHMHTHRK